MKFQSLVLIIGVLASLLILTGCPAKVPVIVEAVPCTVTEQDLMALCVTPAEVKEGITYGEMIQLMREDRQRLTECKTRHSYLADQLRICNQKIEEHNQEIRKINQANK